MTWKRCLGGGLLLAVSANVAHAGVTNPDISVVGQPFMRSTNDPTSIDRKRVRLDVGETELVFDAYLNPFARGFFTLSLSEEGLALEEGYFSLFRKLPLGMALKGGQYRVGFGRINSTHPHAQPFSEPFHVITSYLPGEEALVETGLSLSDRIPVHGDFSIELSGDWLQGDAFRAAREASGDPNDPLANGGDDDAGQSRPAFAARVSGFAMLGEQSALEFGLSATGGTNNVAAGTETRVYGADVKAKLWTTPRAYLVIQAEGLALDRQDAGWDPLLGYTQDTMRPIGGYVFADYNWATLYDVGASYERYQDPSPAKPVHQAIGAFAGYSLMEETTVFRFDWAHFIPDVGDAVDTFTLRVIFSMGPHKAHQF